jgi:hypothetical protein
LGAREFLPTPERREDAKNRNEARDLVGQGADAEHGRDRDNKDETAQCPDIIDQQREYDHQRGEDRPDQGGLVLSQLLPSLAALQLGDPLARRREFRLEAVALTTNQPDYLTPAEGHCDCSEDE